MPASRSLATVAAFACLLMTADAADDLASAQTGTSGSRELRAIDDLETGLSSLLSGFLGGSESRQVGVERVTVVEEDAQRVVLRVATSGLEGARLGVEVRRPDRRPVREVSAAPADVTATPAEVTLTITLSDDLPAGASVESGSIRLLAVRGGRTLPIRAYALRKTWSRIPEPSEIVHTITPQPIGAAARLGPTPPSVAPKPARILVPVRPLALSEAQTPIAKKSRTAAVARLPADRIATAARQPATGTQAAATQPARPAAPVLRVDKTVEKKAAPALLALPPSRVAQIAQLKYGLDDEARNVGALGPGNTPIDLFEGLSVDDGTGLNLRDVTRLMPQLYQDRNPASGVFYYLPQQYHVHWTQDDGYGLRILYGAAVEDGQAGEVRMAARLANGVDASEIQLARELLAAYVARHKDVTRGKPPILKRLPVDGPPVLSFGGVAQTYNIPPEKIVAPTVSDLLDELEVGWVTDPVTKENIQVALAEPVGVSGTVALTPTGGELPVQNVPVGIRFADPHAFGMFRWTRNGRWRNPTPYPVRLRYLHALYLDPSNRTPVVYSWSLNNTAVQPASQVEWSADAVPAWIDGAAKRVWIDYAVVDDCAECDRQVIEAVTGGVSSLGTTQITFRTITPLADTGAFEIVGQVRSKYFDPKTRSAQVRVLPLKADGEEFTLGPLYLVNRQVGDVVPGDPLYEYTLEVVMPDGTTYPGTRWIPGDSPRVLIGRAQVQQAVGTMPAPPDAPAEPEPEPEPEPEAEP